MKKYSLFELFSSQNNRSPNLWRNIIKKILFQTSQKKQWFLYKMKFYSFVSTVSVFLIFVVLFLFFDMFKEKDQFKDKNFEQKKQSLLSQGAQEISKKNDNNAFVDKKNNNKEKKGLEVQNNNQRMSIKTLKNTDEKQLPPKESEEDSKFQNQKVWTLSKDSSWSKEDWLLDNIKKFFKTLKQIFFK